MSLDTPFKQIFLTKQQLNEETERTEEGWNCYISANCIYLRCDLPQTCNI